MDYLLYFLAFVATLTAVLDKILFPDKASPLTWFSVGIAAMVLLVSIRKQITTDKEHRIIGQVAYNEILRSLHSLLQPLFFILASQNGISKEQVNNFINPNKFNLKENNNIISSLNKLIEKYEFLKATKLDDSSVMKGNTWRNVFQKTVIDSRKGLDYTMNTYRSMFKSKEIIIIEKLRNHWLTQRISTKINEVDNISLAEFLHVDQTIEGSTEPILFEFVELAKQANTICIEKLN